MKSSGGAHAPIKTRLAFKGNSNSPREDPKRKKSASLRPGCRSSRSRWRTIIRGSRGTIRGGCVIRGSICYRSSISRLRVYRRGISLSLGSLLVGVDKSVFHAPVFPIVLTAHGKKEKYYTRTTGEPADHGSNLQQPRQNHPSEE